MTTPDADGSADGDRSTYFVTPDEHAARDVRRHRGMKKHSRKTRVKRRVITHANIEDGIAYTPQHTSDLCSVLQSFGWDDAVEHSRYFTENYNVSYITGFENKTRVWGVGDISTDDSIIKTKYYHKTDMDEATVSNEITHLGLSPKMEYDTYLSFSNSHLSEEDAVKLFGANINMGRWVTLVKRSYIRGINYRKYYVRRKGEKMVVKDGETPTTYIKRVYECAGTLASIKSCMPSDNVIRTVCDRVFGMHQVESADMHDVVFDVSEHSELIYTPHFNELNRNNEFFKTNEYNHALAKSKAARELIASPCASDTDIIKAQRVILHAERCMKAEDTKFIRLYDFMPIVAYESRPKVRVYYIEVTLRSDEDVRWTHVKTISELGSFKIDIDKLTPPGDQIKAIRISCVAPFKGQFDAYSHWKPVVVDDMRYATSYVQFLRERKHITTTIKKQRHCFCHICVGTNVPSNYKLIKEGKFHLWDTPL